MIIAILLRAVALPSPVHPSCSCSSPSSSAAVRTTTTTTTTTAPSRVPAPAPAPAAGPGHPRGARSDGRGRQHGLALRAVPVTRVGGGACAGSVRVRRGHGRRLVYLHRRRPRVASATAASAGGGVAPPPAFFGGGVVVVASRSAGPAVVVIILVVVVTATPRAQSGQPAVVRPQAAELAVEVSRQSTTGTATLLGSSRRGGGGLPAATGTIAISPDGPTNRR